ncbi:MAG: 6-bladed beta-propeller [Thermodesulfobacteriota bacterium]
MLKIFKRLLLILPAAVLAFGCAAPKLPDVVWPLPPDEPRIKFVKSYHSSTDIKRDSVAAAIIIGAKSAYRLRKPAGVHVDGQGKIYVTDTAYADVFIYDPVNEKSTSIGTMGSHLLSKPIGVATDSTGRIFVADTRVDKVVVVSPEGRFITYMAPDKPFEQPSGIAIDEPHNRIYVVDTHQHNVRVFDFKTLKYIKTIGGRGAEEGRFNYPSNITVDKDGKLYVVDTMNARVQIFDKEGRFLLTFGRFGDIAGEFARPKGIGVDSEGHIYVADAAFNNVQIFDQEGRILMAFGGYGNGRGLMILPAGLYIDKDDYIYVVDSWNARVVVYEFLGEKHNEREKTKKGG